MWIFFSHSSFLYLEKVVSHVDVDARRSCPGSSLALLVIQATLASLIQCYDWVVNDGKSHDIDMSEVGRVTVFLAKPLKCKPVPHFVLFS